MASGVDLSASFYAEFQRAKKRAEEAERKGDASQAAAAYHQAAEWMHKYAATALDSSARQQRQKSADTYEAIAKRLDNEGSTLLKRAAKPASNKTGDEAAGEDDYEAEVLALIQQTQIRWEDIGGLEQTKQDIKMAYGLALAARPKGVRISGGQNMLLYGPPGTGKTLLAAATAGSLEATFFNVKVSNLLSKYFGESTKLISALYTVARRLNPAVIFLDEFESLTPPRSGESGAERRIVSTLLAELDGLETKSDERFVLTLGATNVPWLLDMAILSRFQMRIYVPLPDADARRSILGIHLTRRGLKSDLPLDVLVQRTEGFSGRDIEQLCQAAVSRMIREHNPGLLSAVDKGLEAVQKEEIRVEPLSKADLDAAFALIHPVANAAMLKRYTEWTDQLGE